MKKAIKNILEKMLNFACSPKNILLGATALVLNTGVANADQLRVTSLTPEISGHDVFCKHKLGVTEGWDNAGHAYFFPFPAEKKVEFYSLNPLTTPVTNDGKVKTDARPLDSMSTYTCPFEGVGLTEPNAPTQVYFENKSGTYQGNNVIAFFYDNQGTDNDPNWAYSGVTLDAQEAGKNPSESYVTVPVRNGLSNVMQVKYFPPEDVDFSGEVNMADISLLSSNWGRNFGNEGIWPRTAYSPTQHPEVYVDVTNNGVVDLEDLVQMVEYKSDSNEGQWLWQKPAYDIDAYDPINPPSPPFSKADIKPTVYNKSVLSGQYLDAFQEQAMKSFYG